MERQAGSPALLSLLAGARDAAADILFPPGLYCSVCGSVIDRSRTYHLCDHCIRHIRWDHAPARDASGLRILRCAEYGVYEKSLIFSLKYEGHTYIARDIAGMMRDKLAETGDVFDCVVPIPLSPEKEKKRGFNQTALIARYLARETGAAHYPHALVRVRETRPMRGLSPEQREENIRGAFALAPGAGALLSGKRVLVLDDFATTGATGREALRALGPAGCADVLFAAFAAKFGSAILGRGEA